MKRYTIGIDYGTLSGRAVLMDVKSGEVIATSVFEYPHGVMDERLPNGKSLPSFYALQHADDYLLVLKNTIADVMKEASVTPEEVVGIGIDFTGCTMMPVDKNMTPLMLLDDFCDEPHAYVKLWKHTSAQEEADDINALAKARGEKWFSIYGSKSSPEWMFAKVLEILREAPKVYEAADKFVNAADWIAYILTGNVINSANFAGYKEFWNEETGFPSAEFFEALDPRMKNVIGDKISYNVLPIDKVAGHVTKEAAEMLGLAEGTAVAVPILDAHASIPALGLTDEGTLMMIFGTSAVHLLHSKNKRNVAGICGYMKDGVISGLYTYEASQACCGDHLGWFVKNCLPSEYTEEARALGMNIHKYLREKAKKLKVGESGLLALDWNNGNRSILTDLSLTGALFGLTLRTKPEEIYRALMEAAVFGTKRIIDNFEEYGIKASKMVASGGIAEKDELFMQIVADVLNREVVVPNAKASASRGSAIYASVASGDYADITEASRALGISEGRVYTPIPENVEIYKRLYAEYCRLHDYFGRGENDVLKKLKKIGE